MGLRDADGYLRSSHLGLGEALAWTSLVTKTKHFLLRFVRLCSQPIPVPPALARQARAAVRAALAAAEVADASWNPSNN